MIPAADVERAVGIEWYATDGSPCLGVAKSVPQDFIVEELLQEGEVSKEELPNYLPLYRVEKRSIDTLHMAKDLADILKSRVSYGGMKDKRAVAVQFVTPSSRRSSRPSQVTRENYTADLVGYVPRPMTRAAVAGNRFSIVLRECSPEIGERVVDAMALAKDRRVPNYYGLQRFGTSSVGTHLVGGALVRGRFDEAVGLLTKGPFSGGRDVENEVAKQLKSRPGDWIGAMRAVPVRLRRLYVQAYQSYLFNRTISEALSAGEDISKMKQGDNWAETAEGGIATSAPRGVKDTPTARAVPMVQLVGYAFRDYGSRFDFLVKKVLEAEEIKPAQFFVKEMQEVSSEGGFRRPHLAVRDASWKVGEGTASLNFTLAKGQYATTLLREITKSRDPAASGLA